MDRKQIMIAIENIERVPYGKELLDHLEELSALDADMFTPDPYQHAYNAGRRAIGLTLRGYRNVN